MADVLYLSKDDLSDLVRKKFRVESVTFGHHEDFLWDEPDGVLIFAERINGEESEVEFSYSDLFHVVLEYVESLELKFCDWRLFTVYECFGAAIIVKRR